MTAVDKIRGRLRRAERDQRMVGITSKLQHANQLDGFVVGVGTEWVVVAHTRDGGFFDGYGAVRLRDIARVRPDRTIEGAFARTRPEWPPTNPFDVNLDSTAGVIEGLGRGGTLIGIQKQKKSDTIWIGTLDEVIGKWVYLNLVRRDAIWNEEPLGHKLKPITTVKVGTSYLVALAAIAGARPDA